MLGELMPLSAAMPPLIITAAITGAETTREDNENLPITPEEQGIAAADAVEAGASVIHLHVRDDQGIPTQDIDRFAAAIEKIRERCGGTKPVIQISTGGSVEATLESREAPLNALHGLYEMATLNLGTMNFFKDVFYNPDPYIKALAGVMLSLGVVPELGVYDLGHIWTAERLLKEDLLKHPLHYTFALGVQGGMKFAEDILRFVASQIPQEDIWGVAGIGRHEFSAAELAIKMGGHVRVGFEDNVYIEKGVKAESNAQLVRKAAALALKAGRRIATPTEVRQMLGIPIRT
ncbi:MAG: 3-keto-5-aminohexanoate cleavage protein [Candidatus Peribacteraceae bacterium]